MSGDMVDTLGLLLSVLKYDMVESWTVDDNNIKCSGLFVSPEIRKEYPFLEYINPGEVQTWKQRSLQLCGLCGEQLMKCIWITSHSGDLHIDLSLDCIMDTRIEVKTAFAHSVDSSAGQSFTVGYSTSEISYHSDKLDFISNICQAAFLSLGTVYSSTWMPDVEELDEKDFFLMDVSGTGDAISKSRPIVDELSLCSKEVTDILHLASTAQREEVVRGIRRSNISVLTETTLQSGRVHSGKIASPIKKNANRTGIISDSAAQSAFLNVPSPKSVDMFYPIQDVPVINAVNDSIKFDELLEMRQRAFGKNSTIYSAVYRDERVVVKLMIPGLETSSIAQREFDNEQNVLRRVSHPNIVRMIGTGHVILDTNRHSNLPLRFTVLEWLDGSLCDILSDSNKKTRSLRKLVQGKKSLPLLARLRICHDLASALKYLHSDMWDGVSIIHREIEPDNLRLDRNGVVKLTGFGRCVCVKARESIACPVMDSHGTLRYTPPEVALRLSYSEKTDVYCLAIVMWQIIRDKVPFMNMSRSDFMHRVVYRNERPKLDKVLPVELARLLARSWGGDQAERPSCHELVQELQGIMISGDAVISVPSILPNRLWRIKHNTTSRRMDNFTESVPGDDLDILSRTQMRSAPSLLGSSPLKRQSDASEGKLDPCTDVGGGSRDKQRRERSAWF